MNKVQRLTCLGKTGAMRTTPTAVTEMLLDLSPLHLLIGREVGMDHYRLTNSQDYKRSGKILIRGSKFTINMNFSAVIGDCEE